MAQKEMLCKLVGGRLIMKCPFAERAVNASHVTASEPDRDDVFHMQRTVMEENSVYEFPKIS